MRDTERPKTFKGRMYMFGCQFSLYLYRIMKVPYQIYHRFVILLFQAQIIVTGRYPRQSSPPRPRFLETPLNVTFNKGEEAVLKCSIENLGGREATKCLWKMDKGTYAGGRFFETELKYNKVVWRKASEPNPLTIGLLPYIENARISVTHDKTRRHWELHIKNVQPRHSGVYECQISSKHSLIQLIMLRVNGTGDDPDHFHEDSPTQIKPTVHITGTKAVDVGQAIKLQCNVTGWSDSLQEVDWFKNGDKITPTFENKVSISKFEVTGTNTFSSYLEIEQSKKSDSGTYLCRNSDGEMDRVYVDVLNTASINKKRGGSEQASRKSDRSSSEKHTSVSPFVLFLMAWISFTVS